MQRRACMRVRDCAYTHTHDLLSIHVSIGLRIRTYLIFCHVSEQHLCLEPVTLLITVKESQRDVNIKREGSEKTKTIVSPVWPNPTAACCMSGH